MLSCNVHDGIVIIQGAFNRLDPTGQYTEHMMRTIPVGRMGERQEFSNLATYFLSDYSSWCSGTVIDFDGGQLPFMAGMFNPLVQVGTLSVTPK